MNALKYPKRPSGSTRLHEVKAQKASKMDQKGPQGPKKVQQGYTRFLASF